MSHCVSPWAYPGMDCLSSLAFIDYIFPHIGELFNYNFFKNFSQCLYFFSSSSSSGIPISQMLVYLILSQMFLRLCSIIFILFPLFYSSAVISTILPSSSLIRSFASVILLLVYSRVFLISVIVLLISVCLFFISSMSLVIVLTMLIIPCIFSFLFPSLWNIFSAIILNSVSGRLAISSLFIYPVLFLNLCCISVFSFFSFFV